MEVEKFIGGKFHLALHAFKAFSRRNTSCCRGATLGKSLSFFGFNGMQP
jgi:hypothetical protein